MANFDIMQFLKGLIAFYINSSLHVALAVIALLKVTDLQYNLSIPTTLFFFLFLATLTGYNFVKYAKVAGLRHRSLTQSLRGIQLISAISFIGLSYFAFKLPRNVILIILGFGLATFLYAVPFIRHKNLRNFSGFKIFVVALVWAGVTVIIPFVYTDTAINGEVLLTFCQRVLIVVVLILPFEIRDVPYDALNLKTIPQQIGVKNTKLLGIAILQICMVLELLKGNLNWAYLVSLSFFCGILGWLLIISKTEQKRYFASFLVEGLPIIWLILYITLENF